MGKRGKNPKRYIISCRLNEPEMAVLKQMADDAGFCISDFLRNRLDMPVAQRRTQMSRARA